jgi:AraC-like DNA-binding protein
MLGIVGSMLGIVGSKVLGEVGDVVNESAILLPHVTDERPVVQTVRERRPVDALAPYVTCVWVQEVAPDSAPFVHRKAPNGSAEVVCVIGSIPHVLGPQTGPVTETLEPGTAIVGVRLRPGAAPSVLHLPASEAADHDLPADELYGSWAVALGEALADASSPDEAAALLERAVGERLADSPELDPVVAEAVQRLHPAEASDVRALASSLYVSERQLRRRCEAATGMTPKTLHRILRFQRFLALAWVLERPSTQLARLAADAGYADQAHLTREARQLEGRSPRTLLLESEQHCCCGHDHTASYGPLLAG